MLIAVGTSLELHEFIRDIRTKVAPKWYDIGVHLGIDADRLNIIKANNPGDVEQCCTEMYQQWLKLNPQANREKLATALKVTGFSVLAKSIIGLEGKSSIVRM